MKKIIERLTCFLKGDHAVVRTFSHSEYFPHVRTNFKCECGLVDYTVTGAV